MKIQNRLCQSKVLLMLSSLFCLSLFDAQAQFDDTAFRSALKLKKDLYITEGAISGGDRTSSNYKISAIRLAQNPAGYDRIVLDFDQLKRPPFFMVENLGVAKKLVVTVYGRPKLDFSTQSSMQAAKKTRTVSAIEFIPLVDIDRFQFSLSTKSPIKSEAFELSDPARIIIDLKP